MRQISTPELFIKQLYNESNPIETAMVKNALQNEPALQRELKKMQEAKNALDSDGGDMPGQHVIDNILAYSQKSAEILV